MQIQSISRDNSDACVICAGLLPLQALATRGQNGSNLFFSSTETGRTGSGASIAWYKLQRGAGALMKVTWDWAREGLLGGTIKYWTSIEAGNKPPLEPEEERNLNALASCWMLSDMLDEDKADLERTLQMLRLVFGMVSRINVQTDRKMGKFRVIFAWTVLIPDGFCAMFERRVPQTLVLIAVYCVLLKRLDEFWWMAGKAEELFDAVWRELPDRSWDKLLEWPAEQIRVR